MNPKISVIIPVYKVEKYLDRCVESIVNQTYENLEIILVDDGSPDNCPAMCDAWAEKDSRIKVIHKENDGSANARNTGLDVATGDYIGFVDSDDYIETEMYEILLNSIVENDSDISMCGHRNVTEAEQPYREEALGDYPDLVDFEFFYSGNNFGEANCIICNKLYRKKLWENSRFKDYRIYDDEAVLPYIYAKASRISIVKNSILYNYRLVEGSIMHQQITKKNFVLFDILEERLCFVREKYSSECYRNTIISALKSLRNLGIALYNQQENEKVKHEYKQRFLAFYRSYSQPLELSKKTKTAYNIFCHFPNLYLKILKLL